METTVESGQVRRRDLEHAEGFQPLGDLITVLGLLFQAKE
jgi:hypothetical protein